MKTDAICAGPLLARKCTTRKYSRRVPQHILHRSTRQSILSASESGQLREKQFSELIDRAHSDSLVATNCYHIYPLFSNLDAVKIRNRDGQPAAKQALLVLDISSELAHGLRIEGFTKTQYALELRFVNKQNCSERAETSWMYLDVASDYIPPAVQAENESRRTADNMQKKAVSFTKSSDSRFWPAAPKAGTRFNGN